MKLLFQGIEEQIEIDTDQGRISTLAGKVTKALASDLPDATWRLDIVTAPEVRQVVETMLTYASQVDIE